MTLGGKIKQLRSEKGLSQSALEKISGVNSKLLSKYENERIVPTADSLRKIAEALQISADYLIFDNAPRSGLSQLEDLELFEKFQEVEKMTAENRCMIKNLIDALIIKSKVEGVIKPASADPWELRMKKTLTKLRQRAKGYSEEELLKIVDKAVEEVRCEEKKKTRIKAVIDTNLFVSGLFAGEGPTSQLQELWANSTIELAVSEKILQEVRKTLQKPYLHKMLFFIEGEEEEIIDLIREKAHIITQDRYETDKIKEDPTDNKFLACALEAKADYIVSGDSHLLSIKHYHGIQIVDARIFVKIVKEK